MVVAGDHAQNDMAGEDETSWKKVLTNEGFNVETYLHGLGELEKFQDIYIKHVEDAFHDTYLGVGHTKKGGQ
jgi:sirohydrochlorin cobaltochelatase